MNYSLLSPYVRRAWDSTLKFPFEIKPRIILDYEIIYVSDGCCLLTMGEEKYSCKKDDIIFIRPGIEHSITGINNADFVQPHVHFDLYTDELSEKVFVCYEKFKSLSPENQKLLRKDYVDIGIPTVFNLSNHQYFKAQLYELIEFFSRKGTIYQLLCKEKMLHLLYIVFSEFDKEAKTANDRTNMDMLNIKSYIDGNYTQKLDLDFLADKFFINKYYMEVNFKKYFGMPVIKYYNQVRFDKACQILLKGESVGSVAEKLGFDNIFSFSRFFKNYSGMSPSKYKKSEPASI